MSGPRRGLTESALMHVVIALAVAALASLLVVLVIGGSPVLAIPIMALGVGFAALFAVIVRRRSQRTLDTDVPSTQEASYTPVVDPAERE